MNNTVNSKPVQLSEVEARMRLDDYVSEHGWPDGLTDDKVIDRAIGGEFIDGKLRFSMERHQPIGPHVTGTAMAGYIEEVRIYEFDPIEGEFSITTEGEPEINIPDVHGLADRILLDTDVFVEKEGAGLYRFGSICWGIEESVASLEEARELIRSIFDGMDFSHELVELPDEVQGEYEKQLADASVQVMLNRLNKAWEKADDAAS